jgi:hypothetical protein
MESCLKSTTGHAGLILKEPIRKSGHYEQEYNEDTLRLTPIRKAI